MKSSTNFLETLVDYKIYVISVLSFVDSLTAPDETVLKE